MKRNSWKKPEEEMPGEDRPIELWIDKWGTDHVPKAHYCGGDEWMISNGDVPVVLATDYVRAWRDLDRPEWVKL